MEQKTALVTGASRGFGAAAAEHLASGGYHVIALARTQGGLEDLDDRVRAHGGQTTLVPADITDDEAMARLGHSIFERYGTLDLWLHTAIFAGPLSPVEHIPANDWAKTLTVNIRATQRLIAMLDPLLRAASGTALLPTDKGAGEKFFGAYGAAKSAQLALWNSWAAETANTGMSVRTIAPAPMPTALRARFFPGEDRAALADPRAEAARLL